VTDFNNNVFSGVKNLTRISIGADVAIAGTKQLAFNFEAYYKTNSLKAGTYTYSNGRWNFQAR